MVGKRRSRITNSEWNDKCEVAMKILKEKLTSAPKY